MMLNDLMACAANMLFGSLSEYRRWVAEKDAARDDVEKVKRDE